MIKEVPLPPLLSWALLPPWESQSRKFVPPFLFSPCTFHSFPLHINVVSFSKRKHKMEREERKGKTKNKEGKEGGKEEGMDQHAPASWLSPPADPSPTFWPAFQRAAHPLSPSLIYSSLFNPQCNPALVPTAALKEF